MQWPPICDNCESVLVEPGALIITPPNESLCKKFHICVECYTENMFLFLAKKWREEQAGSSHLNVDSVYYKAIIDLKQKVILYILKDLQKSPDWWGPALTKITGECPIPNEIAGQLGKITDCWIQWGKDRGYIK